MTSVREYAPLFSYRSSNLMALSRRLSRVDVNPISRSLEIPRSMSLSSVCYRLQSGFTILLSSLKIFPNAIPPLKSLFLFSFLLLETLHNSRLTFSWYTLIYLQFLANFLRFVPWREYERSFV